MRAWLLLIWFKKLGFLLNSCGMSIEVVQLMILEVFFNPNDSMDRSVKTWQGSLFALVCSQFSCLQKLTLLGQIVRFFFFFFE